MYRSLTIVLVGVELASMILVAWLAVAAAARRNGEGPRSMGRLVDRMILPILVLVGVSALVHIGTNVRHITGPIPSEANVGLWGETGLAIGVFGILWWAGRWYLLTQHSLRGTEKAMQALLGSIHGPAIAGLDALTPRENDVLALLSTGETSDQAIADQLHISKATAATHVRNILAKTGLHERRALILLAHRQRDEAGS